MEVFVYKKIGKLQIRKIIPDRIYRLKESAFIR